jgi:hypothetical protein
VIPHRENGYSFEPGTLVVHERYQDHSPEAVRTRSIIGIVNTEVRTGTKATPCEVCFPAPKKPGRVQRWAPAPSRDAGQSTTGPVSAAESPAREAVKSKDQPGQESDAPDLS